MGQFEPNASGGGMTRRATSFPPRGLRVDQAAMYLGMGRSKFLDLVSEGRLPKPKIIDSMAIWDRLALDSAFDDFPERSDSDNVAGHRNSFDEVLRGS
jgi:predicted DNA-binding transcriptional regulator AlpA